MQHSFIRRCINDYYGTADPNNSTMDCAVQRTKGLAVLTLVFGGICSTAWAFPVFRFSAPFSEYCYSASVTNGTGGTDRGNSGRFWLYDVALGKSADELWDDTADVRRLFRLLSGCILLTLSDTTISSSPRPSTIKPSLDLSFVSFSCSAKYW